VGSEMCIRDRSYVFQARQRMEFLALSRVLGQSALLISGVLLVFVSRQIVAVPIANLLGTSLSAALSFYWLRRRMNLTIGQTRLRDFGKTWSAATPFVATGVFTAAYHNVVPVLLRSLIDLRSVGLFSAGYRILMVLVSGADIISNALLPAIAFSFKNDRPAFSRQSLVLARALGGVAFATTVIGWLMSPLIFEILFGAEYALGLGSFRILILLPVLGMLSTALTTPLLVANEQVHCMLSVVTGVAVTILASVVLVPRIGIAGAAIGTLLGEGGILVYLLIIFQAKLQFAKDVVASYISKPALASLAVLGSYAVWTYIIHFPVSILEGIALICVYVACAAAIRLVPRELLFSNTARDRGQ